MDYSLLKLDIDIPSDLFGIYKIQFIRTRKLMLEYLGFKMTDFDIKESTRGHIHIRIWINPPAKHDSELNMLQFLCGDSHYRFVQNQKRICEKMTHWNKLFFKKVKLNEIQL